MTTLPEFLNGELQPSRYDDVFKHIVSDAQMWTGDDQSIGWVTSMMLVNKTDIVRAVSATGNPAASVAGAVVPGWYLMRVNSDGLIWAYFYADRIGDANADFSEAELVYEKWETAR